MSSNFCFQISVFKILFSNFCFRTLIVQRRRLVAPIYDDASKLFTKMKQNDKTLTKFLETAAEGTDEVDVDAYRKNALLADEQLEHKKDILKKIGIMSTIVKKS